DEGGAGGGTVTLPEFKAGAAVIGPEEERPVDVRQVAILPFERKGVAAARVNVPDEGGTGGGAVAPPQLFAVASVIGCEEESAGGGDVAVPPLSAAADAVGGDDEERAVDVRQVGRT